MELRLPDPSYNKIMDWSFIDSMLERWIQELPDYLSKREFKTFISKKMDYPLGFRQSAEQSRVVRRLVMRAQRTKRVTLDLKRRRMLFVNKPHEVIVSH